MSKYMSEYMTWNARVGITRSIFFSPGNILNTVYDAVGNWPYWFISSYLPPCTGRLRRYLRRITWTCVWWWHGRNSQWCEWTPGKSCWDPHSTSRRRVECGNVARGAWCWLGCFEQPCVLWACRVPLAKSSKCVHLAQPRKSRGPQSMTSRRATKGK